MEVDSGLTRSQLNACLRECPRNRFSMYICGGQKHFNHEKALKYAQINDDSIGDISRAPD